MVALVRRAERSGRPLAEFAREHGLAPQTLYWWRKRVASQEPIWDEAQLLPVAIQEEPVGPTSTGEPIEVQVGPDLVLRIPARTDPTRVADLVSALRRC